MFKTMAKDWADERRALTSDTEIVGVSLPTVEASLSTFLSKLGFVTTSQLKELHEEIKTDVNRELQKRTALGSQASTIFLSILIALFLNEGLSSTQLFDTSLKESPFFPPRPLVPRWRNSLPNLLQGEKAYLRRF